MPSLAADYAGFVTETDRLRALMGSTVTLNPAHRKYIAEIALLRLAILMENALYTLCCKVACGAPYLDGSVPNLIAQQRNIPSALIAMQTLNRPRFHNLKWNDGSSVRDNLKFVVHGNDPIFRQLINHAAFMTEIRYIRNHVAHRNDGTRRNFITLVHRYYGANVRGITVGNLLLSPRVSRPALLEAHITRARVFMKDITKA